MTMSRRLFLPDDAATTQLGQALAEHLRPGDTVLLSGGIGAGKTHLARAIIRALCGAIDVPSPTYTLVQTYQAIEAEIWHADLYRLTDPSEVLELGLDDALTDSIVLIEWPDRLGMALPNALSIALAVKDDGRECVITSASDTWKTAVDALEAAHA